MSTVVIDLNVRLGHSETFSGLEDVTGPIAVGDRVTAIETESGLTGPAYVTAIEPERGLVYLRIAWNQLRFPE